MQQFILGNSRECFLICLHQSCTASKGHTAVCVPPQVEEPYDPERCLDYPLQLDLDLDCDLGDNETFDVEDGKKLSNQVSRLFLVFAWCSMNAQMNADLSVLGQFPLCSGE